MQFDEFAAQLVTNFYTSNISNISIFKIKTSANMLIISHLELGLAC